MGVARTYSREGKPAANRKIGPFGSDAGAREFVFADFTLNLMNVYVSAEDASENKLEIF